MTSAVHGFPGGAAASRRLAEELGVPHHEVSVRHFPDGESLVRVQPSSDMALLHCSLDHPNAKLIQVVLAASALRDSGAKHVVLVAPYLCYMRQDTAFHAGEAVSQRVIGRLIAEHFDGLIAIDPHLHRTPSLSAVMPGLQAASVSAAPLLASAIDAADKPLLVGPDEEGRQWVERIATLSGLECLLGRKQRTGDREVAISFPEPELIAGRSIVLIDDVISSGATLLAAAKILRHHGATIIDVLATHCLATSSDLEGLRKAGIHSIRATDSVAGPVAILSTAGLLADEIRRRGWHR